MFSSSESHFFQLHAKGSPAAPKWHNDACSHKTSSTRHEESSCCQEGYSGLRKVASPALTWAFLTDHPSENTLAEVGTRVFILKNLPSVLHAVHLDPQRLEDSISGWGWACGACRKCWVRASFGCSSLPRWWSSDTNTQHHRPSRGSFTYRSGLKWKPPKTLPTDTFFLLQLECLHSFTRFLFRVIPSLLGTRRVSMFLDTEKIWTARPPKQNLLYLWNGSAQLKLSLIQPTFSKR